MANVKVTQSVETPAPFKNTLRYNSEAIEQIAERNNIRNIIYYVSNSRLKRRRMLLINECA